MRAGVCGVGWAIAAAALWGAGVVSGAPPDAQVEGDVTLRARGAYVARLGDCAGCHTEKGGQPYAGGKAVNSPLGKIYATNITPDARNGIGQYTLNDFERVMREGIRRDGAHLYPAMPYASFTGMTDNDLRALYAYLMRDVAPVAVAPPPTALPFPFNQRWGVAFWNAAFKRQTVFAPDPERDTVWNRGAYLVRTLGHCGSCHTARGLAYQEQGYDEKSPAFLSGGVVDLWFAPPLRGDAGDGLGRWSEADIVAFLKTGHGGGGAAFGSMREVIEDSTQHFSEADLQAVAVYLKALAPSGDEPSFRLIPDAPDNERAVILPQRIERPGAGIYASYCARCHGVQGSGAPSIATQRSDTTGSSAAGAGTSGRYPALAGNPAVLASNPLSVVRLVLAGGQTAHTASGPSPVEMPAFAGKLTASQIADVVSYIRGAWGNRADPVSTATVQSLIDALAP